MQAFLLLIGQIFLIAIINSILEIFVADNNPLMGRIIKIACYLGSLYLLLNFIFENLFVELSSVINFMF